MKRIRKARPVEVLVRFIRSLFCSHICYLENMQTRENGNIECHCRKCGKLLVAEYGLALRCRFERKPNGKLTGGPSGPSG